MRLARGDFISGPCNAQVSFKKDPTGILDSDQKSNKKDVFGFKIYPNPAYEIVTIEKNSSNADYLNYELLNSKGQIVKSGTISQSFASIKVKALTAGVYLLKTYLEKSQIQTRKIIVE